MRLFVDIIDTRLEFDDEDRYLRSEVIKEAHYKLGASDPGFIHSPQYKNGIWDGIIDFYNPETDTFPTGLMGDMKDLLGELQAMYGFHYTIVDDRPDPFVYPEDMDKEINLEDDKMGEITLRPYQYDAVKSIIENKNGIVNISTGGGKTEVASGIIQQIMPYLERGEKVAFFTDKKEIFEQSAKRIEQRLGIKVGLLGSGKQDIQQVTCVMVPTVNSALKDPEKGIKYTEKERIYKKIAREVLPKFEHGVNQRELLHMYINNFTPKTKIDEKLLKELEKVYETSGSDQSVLMSLKNYNAKFEDTIRKKNKKTYDKHKFVKDYMEQVAVMICDEAHHTTSDTWYHSLRTCKNALYRIGLTGSIDQKNELLVKRMTAIFGEIVSKIRNDFLIKEGHSAKPTIKVFPITAPTDIDKISYYQTAYEKGIVNNEFRNTLIAKLGKMWYDKGEGTLIIVNIIQHGENISELLESMGVEHYFLHGQLPDEERTRKLQEFKEGKVNVMIATSIVDEGVDIAGIRALVLAAGGRSLRQTLQRVGRALRRKEDDNTCQVFDFTDYTNKFLLTHSKERRKVFIEENFDIVDIKG